MGAGADGPNGEAENAGHVRMASQGARYFALIGDIVKSRQLKNRSAVQRAVQGALQAVNDELPSPPIAAAFKLTAGDEIQGLLRSPEWSVDVVSRIADHVHPVSVVWGLGAGSLATDLGRDVATLDGPCFYRARSAVTAAKSEQAWLRVEGVPSPHAESTAALFRLMGSIRSRWTEAQVRYIRAVRQRRQREVARMHGVDESTVSKALHAARFRDVEEGERAARQLLAWVGGAESRWPEESDS